MTKSAGWSSDMDRRLDLIKKDPTRYAETVRREARTGTFKTKSAAIHHATKSRDARPPRPTS